MPISIPKIKVFKNNFIENNNLPLKRDGKKVYFKGFQTFFQREIALRNFNAKQRKF